MQVDICIRSPNFHMALWINVTWRVCHSVRVQTLPRSMEFVILKKYLEDSIKVIIKIRFNSEKFH